MTEKVLLNVEELAEIAGGTCTGEIAGGTCTGEIVAGEMPNGEPGFVMISTDTNGAVRKSYLPTWDKVMEFVQNPKVKKKYTSMKYGEQIFWG